MRAKPATLIALLLTAPILTGCTLEQMQIGQWYIIDTPPAGACPGLEWRFVINPQRAFDGYLSPIGRARIANLAGQLGPDDSFQVTATDVADKRTTAITGRFTSQISTIAIHGDAAGSACDGQIFHLNLGRYFSSAGGGGGGGG
jgi:hypothetical protein